jgi:Reverse transcriptase (RNA-dependent DNA polymerase)
LYASPLSTIISKSSVHHHLYADDTQLFISFYSDKFRGNVSFLENAIAEVYSWMSANLLMLNPSKTEFLHIGIPKQLSKIENPSLSITPFVTFSPVSSARNLGVLFDSNLSQFDHISSIIKSRIFHVRDIRRLELILDQPLLAILLPLSSILSWAIVTHYFSTLLQINLIVFSLFLTLLLVLSQVFQNVIT